MTQAPIGSDDDLKKCSPGHLFILRTWAFVSLLAAVYDENVSMQAWPITASVLQPYFMPSHGLTGDILEPETSY